jgi:hypothetical protein
VLTIGTLFGAIITLACIASLALLGITPLLYNSPQEKTTELPPDAHVNLTLGNDGCHVIRSDVSGPTPVNSLTWVIKDMDDYILLKRNAEGEHDTKYLRGGQYKVHVEAWYSGRYYQISNQVLVDCPQGP